MLLVSTVSSRDKGFSFRACNSRNESGVSITAEINMYCFVWQEPTVVTSSIDSIIIENAIRSPNNGTTQLYPKV
jgi:hypothetical protein